MTVSSIGNLVTVASNQAVSTTPANYDIPIREADTWPLASPSSGLIIYVTYTAGTWNTIVEDNFTVDVSVSPVVSPYEWYHDPELGLLITSPSASTTYRRRFVVLRPSRASWEAAVRLSVFVSAVGDTSAGTYTILARALNTTVFNK